MKSILILGGARSGKSHFAQELALKSDQPVLFVATATAGDEEMHQRIEQHKKNRPATWKTLEVTTHLGNQILPNLGGVQSVVVDCITLLVNNIFQQYREDADASLFDKAVVTEINELIHCIDRANVNFIIVSNEVGLGLVPADRISRLYRDLLGKANQMLAKRVDEVYLMVVGLPLVIKPTRAL